MKDKIKRLYSLLTQVIGINGVFNTIHKNKLIILMYHQCKYPDDNFPTENIVTPENFDQHVRYLSRTKNVIRFTDLLHTKKTPENSVIITFDDGTRDLYQNAFPILKKYNVPATIFLCVKNILNNEPFWWDQLYYCLMNTQVSEINYLGKTISLRDKEEFYTLAKNHLKYVKNPKTHLDEILNQLNITMPSRLNNILRLEEIKEMKAHKIEFENHGYSHRIFGTLNNVEIEEEISLSHSFFRDYLDVNPFVFCYPNGKLSDFDSRTINVLKEYQYKYAVTTISGFNKTHNVAPFQMRRIGLSYEDDITIFRAKIAGAFNFISHKS